MGSGQLTKGAEGHGWGQQASEGSADGLVIRYKVKWTNRTHCENSKEHVAVNCTGGQPRGHDGGGGRSPLGSFACWAST